MCLNNIDIYKIYLLQNAMHVSAYNVNWFAQGRPAQQQNSDFRAQ